MWQVIESWAGLTILISLALSVVGIVMVLMMILWMPEDHFVTQKKLSAHAPPAWRVAWLCFRYTLGLALLGLGVIMIITPGPGLISILLGLSLMDLPGKQQLLRRGLRLKSVRGSLNWIRRKFDKPPLRFPRRSERKR